MATVKILKGTYRNEPVRNVSFTLVKGFTTGKKGSYVTVKNGGRFPVDIEDVKIKVKSPNDIQISGSLPEAVSATLESTAEEASVHTNETDDEAMDRIATRFSILDKMAKACIAGDVRAMIVTGPPGVGKSHGVTTQMERASLFDKLADSKPRYEIVKGAMSGIGLFATLFKYSDHKNVLVFDDCDVWEDQDALNVLKGALDSSKTRRISWNKDSRLLKEEGVPNTFNFHGSVIFITNLNFGEKRSKKIQAHLDALQSRCHFLDLTITSDRDKMLRIRQVHRDTQDNGGLFKDYNFDKSVEDMIIDYMWANHTRLREISMRMAIKLADLWKVDPTKAGWEEMVEATCMRKAV